MPRPALLLALAAAALAQSVRIDRVRADIAFLSSEPLEGRRSLERGSDVAALFVAAEFEKAGLKPAAGNSYLQRFDLIAYRPEPSRMRLVVEQGGKRTEHKYGPDFSGSFPRDLTVAGPIVFAGYGVTAPEFGYDDYAGLDVRGRIALIFEYEPQAHNPRSPFNGEGNTRHASPRSKVVNAQQHGAAGLLVIPAPNRKRRLSFGRSERSTGPLLQALAENEARIPVFTLHPEAAARLVGRKLGELQAAIDGPLKPVRVDFAGTRAEMRCAVAESRRGVTANVLGLIEGADPTLRAETVLFTSHYDHLGLRDGKVLPGADDNASGTAAVIELARLFAAAPRPRRTLLFVSFGAEEPGLLGSYFYTAHPLRPLETTRAVLNLDMNGRDETPSAQTAMLIEIAPDTSNEINLVGTFHSPKLGAAIERENREIALRLSRKWEHDASLNVLWRCDHFPFLMRQVEAVWFFNGFTPDYHQPTDTVEKLNFAKMEKIVRLAYRTGRALASEF